MSEDELIVFVFSIVCAFAGSMNLGVGSISPLSLRNNPGPGLVRLAIAGSMVWLGFVLWKFADPSVSGIYDVFYLVMGLAVVLCFGKLGACLFGIHPRVDVGERRNWPAALFVAAFMLGTGLIFGGSLWGEADPTGGGDEGGWWIPLGFFLLGWTVMVGSLALYIWREPGSFRRHIRHDRDADTAMAAASFTLSSSILMISAVSGDFWGWTEGLKDIASAAMMLLAHEFIRIPDRLAERQPTLRTIESMVYPAIVIVNFLFQWFK